MLTNIFHSKYCLLLTAGTVQGRASFKYLVNIVLCHFKSFLKSFLFGYPSHENFSFVEQIFILRRKSFPAASCMAQNHLKADTGLTFIHSGLFDLRFHNRKAMKLR